MSEEDAKAAGIKVKVGKFSFMANSRARAVLDTDGMVRWGQWLHCAGSGDGRAEALGRARIRAGASGVVCGAGQPTHQGPLEGWG